MSETRVDSDLVDQIAEAVKKRLASTPAPRTSQVILNIAALKAQNFALVFNELKVAVDAARPGEVQIKLEDSLSHEERAAATALIVAAGAKPVATPLRAEVSPQVSVQVRGKTFGSEFNYSRKFSPAKHPRG